METLKSLRQGRMKPDCNESASAFFKTGGGYYPTNHPTTGPNRNFCSVVAKRGKAFSRHNTHVRHMVPGKELTAGFVEQAKPLPSDGNIRRIARHNAALLVRVIAKLCGVTESLVPIGYEDEKGFHYGADSAGRFFTI